jgi:hypothetical protein
VQLFGGSVGLLNGAFGAAISGFGFLTFESLFLVPDTAEDFFAVGEVSAVGAENFEGDRAVVANGLQRADAMNGIDRSGAQWQVKVGAAAFVIMKMNMLEAFSVSIEQLVGGVDVDEKVGMADVKVKGKFGHSIHQITDLAHCIVSAGKVFNHQTDAEFARKRKQGADNFKVLFDDECAIVKGSLAVGMNVHPLCAESRECFETDFEFFNDGSPHRFEWMTKRQVVRGMANDGKLMIFQRGPHGIEIKIAGRGQRRFQSEIDEVEARASRPRDFVKKVAARMIHRADKHRMQIRLIVNGLDLQLLIFGSASAKPGSAIEESYAVVSRRSGAHDSFGGTQAMQKGAGQLFDIGRAEPFVDSQHSP